MSNLTRTTHNIPNEVKAKAPHWVRPLLVHGSPKQIHLRVLQAALNGGLFKHPVLPHVPDTLRHGGTDDIDYLIMQRDKLHENWLIIDRTGFDLNMLIDFVQDGQPEGTDKAMVLIREYAEWIDKTLFISSHQALRPIKGGRYDSQNAYWAHREKHKEFIKHVAKIADEVKVGNKPKKQTLKYKEWHK